MTKCPACKVAGYKKKKFTQDAFDVCGIKNTKLSYYVHSCGSCGHSTIDVKSLDKSRKELFAVIVSCEPEAFNRTAMGFLLQHLFKDSLFIMSNETGFPAMYLKDVLQAKRPLTDEISQRIQEASYLMLMPEKNIKFVIED